MLALVPFAEGDWYDGDAVGKAADKIEERIHDRGYAFVEVKPRFVRDPAGKTVAKASTGKEGKGILPVEGEPLGAAAVYGNDRLFVYLGLAGEHDDALQGRLAALGTAGHAAIERTAGDGMHDEEDEDRDGKQNPEDACQTLDQVTGQTFSSGRAPAGG